MEIRKTTENVLAIADDVIASLASGCVVDEAKYELPLSIYAQTPVFRNQLDKGLQKDLYSVTKAVQHCQQTKSIAVQNISLSVDLGMQTESCVVSLGVQTEPDTSRDFIKEAFKRTTNIVTLTLVNTEEMWRNLINRLNRLNMEFKRISNVLNSVTRSRDFFEKKIKETQCFHSIFSLLQRELESRCGISEEEQETRYTIALLANRAIIGYHRECEKAFVVTQNELIEKLDEIDILQKKLSELSEDDAIYTASIISGACHDVTEKNLAEDIDDNESVNEMKKLLTECWGVLDQDM
ncbi:hypothetical protein TraAM80_00185 [Trypanosoma rangeli]|uniref:Uncharacterized protein n=1 Tax=Trypanosoma rangeli TaxID=5698 RepID=A0A3R7KZC7_TRYRA|nr:uncharacterized protein TraAM80_00185 [Trypanosoma rangeli]RNF12642.1 hypothetical protein TraAM80_00185 [Trypanosoma rangeli]|eukprot:RNF12642.1 hypothetical protein TraAM80_00185 [Trypanosoma rangeli]